MAAYLGIIMMHYFDHFDHPSSARFFLPYVILLSLAPALYAAVTRTLSPGGLVALSLGMLILYHPVAMKNRFHNTLVQLREVRFVYQFLKEYDKKDLLIIDDRPGQYSVLNHGAVNICHARNNRTRLLNELERNLCTDRAVGRETATGSAEDAEPGKRYKRPYLFCSKIRNASSLIFVRYFNCRNNRLAASGLDCLA